MPLCFIPPLREVSTAQLSEGIGSPWRAGIITMVRIDPDETRLDLRRDPVSSREVARPDTRAKPILACVG